MPIYEYACTSCGAECEILQRLSDAPERVCPNCGAETLVKQVSAAGFRLKGGGWYETDFKSEDKRNLARDESAAKPADAKAGNHSTSSGDKVAATQSEGKQGKPAKSPDRQDKKTKRASPAGRSSKATSAAPSS